MSKASPYNGFINEYLFPATNMTLINVNKIYLHESQKNTAVIEYENNSALVITYHGESSPRMNVQAINSVLLYQNQLEAFVINQPSDITISSRFAKKDDTGFWTRGSIEQIDLHNYWVSALHQAFQSKTRTGYDISNMIYHQGRQIRKSLSEGIIHSFDKEHSFPLTDDFLRADSLEQTIEPHKTVIETAQQQNL